MLTGAVIPNVGMSASFILHYAITRMQLTRLCALGKVVTGIGAAPHAVAGAREDHLGIPGVDEDRVGLDRAQDMLPVAPIDGAAEYPDLARVVGLAEVARDASEDVRLVSHVRLRAQFFLATIGQPPWSIGRKASSAGIVAISL